MKKNQIDKKSILFKMTGFVVIVVVLQTFFLIGALVLGGVLKQIKENAYQSFNDKVQNRNTSLKNEMKNNWSNMTPFIQQISSKLSKEKSEDAFFEAVMDDLIGLLRTTKTSGAFIVLDGEKNEYPALYLRDYEPRLNDYSNKDLYMILGPAAIAKEYKIPLDRFWKYKMEFNSINKNFFEKPFSKASLSFNTSLLGYWSSPFSLFPDDLPIITYSMPLFDSNKNLRGIIGIEISVSYFSKYIPANDLQGKDSLGYLIGFREDDAESISPVLMVGAMQKRMIKKNSALELIDMDRNLYVINNSNSEERIYASVDQIGLYNRNTPFENESWFLIGMMTENHLLGNLQKIERILWLSVFASILIGILGGSVISYFFTKPITRLVKRVGEREQDESVQLLPTGFTEIDGLSNAMDTAHKRLMESTVKMSKIIDLVDFPVGAFEITANSDKIFVTEQFQTILEIEDETLHQILSHKNLFLEYLQSIMKSPLADEENVFTTGPGEDKFIRVKIIENEHSTTGVILLVSDEIRVKNLIKQERDFDPLTKIWNRKAVQSKIERAIIQSDAHEVAALLMFDLDRLKVINDSYGHKWGDFYIKEAVAALSSIGSSSGILGRRSGDEFVLFLSGYKKREDILSVINDFYKALDDNPLTYPDGSSKAISISAGLLWITNNYIQYDELLDQADALLYVAKNEKKGFYIEGQIDHRVELHTIKDPLTNIFNKTFLEEILDKELARSIRNQNYITILLIDIDLFHAFNESYGQLKGDSCLIDVVKTIQGSVNRQNDVIARYGSDEICVILPEVSPEGAKTMAQAILFNINNKKIPHIASPLGIVTLSLGIVSLIPQKSDCAQQLLGKVQIVLTNAKSCGLNHIGEDFSS